MWVLGSESGCLHINVLLNQHSSGSLCFLPWQSEQEYAQLLVDFGKRNFFNSTFSPPPVFCVQRRFWWLLLCSKTGCFPYRGCFLLLSLCVSQKMCFPCRFHACCSPETPNLWFQPVVERVEGSGNCRTADLKALFSCAVRMRQVYLVS